MPPGSSSPNQYSPCVSGTLVPGTVTPLMTLPPPCGVPGWPLLLALPGA